jgi:hypothetical protein
MEDFDKYTNIQLIETVEETLNELEKKFGKVE